MSAPGVTFVFVGVGGQGALSAAGFLGQAVFQKGIPVTVSQLHGMSQRGGSVQAAVTVGVEEVLSPSSNPIDVLIGLELIEATRLGARLRPTSIVLCNDLVVPPTQAALHQLRLPSAAELIAELGRCAPVVRVLDGLKLAQQAGNPGALNAVLLGALSTLPQCPVTPEELLAAMLEEGSARSREANRRAFALGQAALAAEPALA